MRKRLSFTCIVTATVNLLPDTEITGEATAAQPSAYLLRDLLPGSEQSLWCSKGNPHPVLHRVRYRAAIAAVQPDPILRGESPWHGVCSSRSSDHRDRPSAPIECRSWPRWRLKRQLSKLYLNGIGTFGGYCLPFSSFVLRSSAIICVSHLRLTKGLSWKFDCIKIICRFDLG